MPQTERPLSPHLQVYRWELSMAMSILHRATGVALSVGTLLLVCWLLAVAEGATRYAELQFLLASVPGQAALFGWTLALFYHLGNGIRHLFWDAGVGFELPAAYRSGWAVILFTLIATATTWMLGMAGTAP